MIEVPLTQGQVALIDEEDAALILPYKWYARWEKSGKQFYASRNGKQIKGKRQTIRMHRLIVGAKTGEEVDHINLNTLDNRRGNLRIVTHTLNQLNGKAHTNNKTGYRGVKSSKGRYRARVRVNNIHFQSRSFTNPEAAALLRDALVRELVEEKVYLNFPDEHPEWATIEAKRLIAKKKG